MNPCVIIILSLVLLLFVTETDSHSVAVEGGGDANGVVKKCLEKERDALLNFKAQLLQDPDYDPLSSWRYDDDEFCQWSGVTCNDQTGRVTRLDFGDFGLTGEISNSLLNLTSLDHLDLSFNSFNGTIPTFIGSMIRLSYLNLGINDFHGTMPKSIGSMTQLRTLDLSHNSLSGSIPPEFGNLTNLQQLRLNSVGRCRVEKVEWLSHLSHLETLYMDGISLAKANQWVDVILSLPNLTWLSLEGCDLSRVMHPYSSFLNSSSSSSIEFLSLRNNSLTSSIYPWLFPLTSNNLQFLYLSSNMLDGIPKYLGNLSCSLYTFYFSDNSAVVSLPDFLSNLSGCASLSLTELYASRSQLTGPLSDDILKFSSLEDLDLSHNQLNGDISHKLWQLPMLTYLDVSSNNLTLPSTYHISNLSSVQSVYLGSCKVGPLFPKWILTIQNLTGLHLSNTGISDTLPLEFWDMWPSQLQTLNLSSNNISGKVPDLLSNYDKFADIDLSSNSFYGPIPNVSSTVSSLDLSRNNFSGGISFLCQIADGLSFLDLSHNSLTGQLPYCLWNFTFLQVLNLGHNNLFGRFPPSIGSLTQLKVLSLYKNNFSGELPLPLKNCTSLKSLNLGANKFSGEVPVWIGENLSRLYVLILRSNNFSGTIPLQLCQLANLQILDLSMNNLHGSIPQCFSNLTAMVQQGYSQYLPFYDVPKDYYDGEEKYVDHAMIEWQGDEREFFSTLKLLKSIDLSNNSLTGQIPLEITNLHGLIALDLSKNTLSGEIPQKIGEMKKLLSLDLSRNNLSGGIPSSMSQMSLLNYLDLSYNNLSGRIPSSTQLQSFDPSRYYGNTRLCGPPLTKTCPGDEESKVPPLIGKSEGDGEDRDEDLGWFYVGGGMGFATGFWMAIGTLLLNRRGRRAFFHLYDRFRDWVYVKVVVFIASFQKAR